MTMTTGELTWLKAILSSFGVSHPHPMTLHCDSQATIHISQNPVFHERTKYIEVDYHFIRDAIIIGHITTSFVSSSMQIIDIFMKALGKQQYEFLLRKLGIRDLQLEGGYYEIHQYRKSYCILILL